MRPPTKVDVVAAVSDRCIEAADRPEEISANHHAGRWNREDVAHRVVLFLVEFTGLDHRIDFAEAIDCQADVLQNPRAIPFDELRANDAAVRAVHLLHQRTNRTGVERYVVVNEAEEAILAFHQTQHLVGCTAETRVAVDGADECVWH